MKVLIVDDQPDLREMCRRHVEKLKFDITLAASGEEAVPLLNQAWDIILTDLNMPGSVDGIELLHRARQAGNADVIIMTAFPELDTAIRAIREGAYDYLVKPVTGDTLTRAITRCSEKRQLSGELAREKALRAELERAYNELSGLERVKETFGQFVTPEVVQFVLSHPQGFRIHGERVNASILFMDVRSFTPFAGSVPPEESMETLNQIFALVIKAVTEEGGVLNKFLGDGVLALFGAPISRKDHAQACARAALKARDAVSAWSKSREKSKLSPLSIGIGINSGEIVAGCLGTENRTEYSVIGHAVNLCARLVDVAAPWQILAGPETSQLIKGAFSLKPVKSFSLMGISESVHVEELMGEKGSGRPAGEESSSPRQRELI